MNYPFNLDEAPKLNKGRAWLNTNDGIMRVFDGLNWVCGQAAIHALAEAFAELENQLRESAIERLSMMGENETLELKLRTIREWCDRVDFEQKNEPRGIYEAKREGAMAIAHFIDSGMIDRYVDGLRRGETKS